MVDQNGPHYFVAFQTPGPNWVAGLRYNEQPEFGIHVGYMAELQARGLIILSGPFMEKAGGLNGVLADGGMTILAPHRNLWVCDGADLNAWSFLQVAS